MIQSAEIFIKKANAIFSELEGISLEFSPKESSIDFKIEIHQNIKLAELYLEFEMNSKVKFCRSSSYEWLDADSFPWRANTHCPKILKCIDGSILVAKTVQGCWEYIPGRNKLRWYFFHPELTPLMVYDQEDQRQFLQEQEIYKGIIISDSILWIKGEVEEWARTPLGFLPIVCFTDHSDFDTTENLKVQRSFFKNLGIRVTKGFFLYNYTHKKANASFEEIDSRNELISWQEDGHELAYHALSQSYRGAKSLEEFQTFQSPAELKPVTTYIDHGFHLYNFTKQELGNWKDWYSHMEQKGIRLIWSYLDSGEGNLFAVNQLNPRGFTLRNILNSAKEGNRLGIKRSTYSTLRNLIMFGVPEEIFWSSKYFKGSLFGLKKKPSFGGLKNFLQKGGDLVQTVFKSGILSDFKSRIDQIFPNSSFAPLFFKGANQVETNIWVFQTLFVRDFDVVFSEAGLKKLMEEKGAMIAHTYFSYANPGHEGRLFHDENWTIRPQAEAAFGRLSSLIKEQKVWNPTLTEMKSYFDQVSNLEYRLDEKGISIHNFSGITRKIS